MIARLRQWAHALKRDVLVLWLAARDNRIPAAIKLLAAIVAGYALSPIDLIPDFIPVLGLLDDLLLVPAGIWLVLRLIDPVVLANLREVAENHAWPRSLAGAAAIIAIWLGLLAAIGWKLLGPG